jgi:hypothetical protein
LPAQHDKQRRGREKHREGFSDRAENPFDKIREAQQDQNDEKGAQAIMPEARARIRR